MNRLLVVDTETGGLDASSASILSIAGVLWESGRTGERFLINVAEPEICADDRSLEINKIDIEKHILSAVEPAEAVKLIDTFIQDNFDGSDQKDGIVLAGHNVNFDVSFLKRLYRLAGQSFDERFSHRVLDTASVIRFLSLSGQLPLWDSNSTSAFEYFGISPPGRDRHTALGDAVATASLLTNLVRIARPQTPA
ncbi:3'-5' exonuclease [Caulobacter sp. NIBR1757]|uniref:3'-5' exonuclease n=1 Tax=Caulobacter sp. NIBR1757 TaxID=3016000 RepID=UPI0022F0CD9A|nr:3'-5' exonuclease [Caulobacter sp. NIBR1757]